MPVPNTFGTATSAIPLSQLDANFATPITIGNTAVQLGNTVTTLNNMTLANVTISSGTITITNVAVTTANVSGTANVSTLVVVGNATVGGNTTITGNITAANANVTSNLVLSGGTANGVAYLNTSKQVTTGSALVFDGTNLSIGATSTSVKLLAAGTGFNISGTAYAVGTFAQDTTNYRGVFLGYDSSGQIGTISANSAGLSSALAFWTYEASASLWAERARIDSSGNLKLERNMSVGGATPTTSGTGITFPATQSASSDANTLDDYEEGTWPAAFVPSTSGTITLSNNTGTYTKIGRTVTINAALKVSSVSSPVGHFTITGLPFSGGAGATFRCSISILGDGMQVTMTTSLTASMQSGSVLYVFKYSGTGTQVACAQDVQANTEIFIGGTYLTD
jgi:hypothetical protein